MEIVVLTYSSSLFTLFSLSSSLLLVYTKFPKLFFLKKMETNRAEGKRSMKEVVEEEEEEEDEDVEEENKKKRALTLSGRKVTSTGGSTQPCCQVEDCEANLKEAKPYHRRHKVCEHHSKAPAVIVAGSHQRFCQQCSRLRNFKISFSNTNTLHDLFLQSQLLLPNACIISVTVPKH